jgi:hypothetical protein
MSSGTRPRRYQTLRPTPYPTSRPTRPTSRQAPPTSRQTVRRGGRMIPAPHQAPPAPPDPHSFLRRLRRRTVVATVVGFGAFFGLVTVNVVGVTAHSGTTGGTAPGSVSSASAPLPAGDFFGKAGVPISSSSSNQALLPAPALINGGGAPMMSSGGS